MGLWGRGGEGEGGSGQGDRLMLGRGVNRNLPVRVFQSVQARPWRLRAAAHGMGGCLLPVALVRCPSAQGCTHASSPPHPHPHPHPHPCAPPTLHVSHRAGPPPPPPFLPDATPTQPHFTDVAVPRWTCSTSRAVQRYGRSTSWTVSSSSSRTGDGSGVYHPGGRGGRGLGLQIGGGGVKGGRGGTAALAAAHHHVYPLRLWERPRITNWVGW